MATRYTYKSCFGDYGSAIDWKSDRQEIEALRNKVGYYEDNYWRPVKEAGNPRTSGCYEVTEEDEDGMRITTHRYYDAENNLWRGDHYGTTVIAWANKRKPYKENEEEES